MEIELINPDGSGFYKISSKDASESKEQRDVHKFLNADLCGDFRNAINRSPIFANDPKYMSQYNLCCAVIDRLDTCIKKLNTYGSYPNSEEDFLIFMMFACMVKDAIKELLASLGTESPKSEHQYFRYVYRNSPVYNPEKEQPTDEKFFEYLRSLVFAHPFKTSRAKFLKEDEHQYSPWVIVNRELSMLHGENDAVGVRIYTNLSEKILNLYFPFSLLKDYIQFEYEKILLATDWVHQQVVQTEIEWRKIKVNRNQPPIEILIEIDKILASRYAECCEIKEFINYLSCKLSNEDNLIAVEKFRSSIKNCISELCDSVDKLDNEAISEICDRILKYPKTMHQMAFYQLEKIFSCLGDETSAERQFAWIALTTLSESPSPYTST